MVNAALLLVMISDDFITDVRDSLKSPMCYLDIVEKDRAPLTVSFHILVDIVSVAPLCLQLTKLRMIM